MRIRQMIENASLLVNTTRCRFSRSLSGLGTENSDTPPQSGALLKKGGSRLRRCSIATLVLIAVLYFPVGMSMTNQINDDPGFTASAAFDIPGGSHAVAMAEALVDREVNKTPWVSNDPFFLPGSNLSMMPAFQKGIIYAVSRYTLNLQEVIGRPRGSSSMDADLETAQGRIKSPGDIWLWDPRLSIWPQTSSETQYRSAIRLLGKFNERLVKHEATYDIRGDNLLSLLDRVNADLGSSLGDVDVGLKHRSRLLGFPMGIYDPVARDIFYRNKGIAYGYYVILRETGRDFQAIIKMKNLQDVWDNALAELRMAAIQHPFVVSNTETDDFLFNTHLASQGYFISLARTKLLEAHDVVSK